MSLLEDERITKAYERILLREGIPVKRLGPKGKEAFNKIQNKKAKKIGVDPFDKNKIYWDVDGTTWWTSMSAMGNMGDTKEFIKDVKAKKYKVKLQEEKKECPEGHEWDEKMQECLPSSTGIKEQRKLSQKEWNQFKKKGETLEKGGKKYVKWDYKGKTFDVPVVIVEKSEKKECPEGQRWCPIQMKCVTPPGKGEGTGKMQEDQLDEKVIKLDKADVKKLTKLMMKTFNMDKNTATKYVQDLQKKARAIVIPEEHEVSEAKSVEKIKDMLARVGMEISKLPLDRDKKVKAGEKIREVQDILRWYGEK